MQDAMDFGQPKQQGLSFPVSLVQKYRPQVKNFVGLDDVKRKLLGFLENPKPCAILAIGAPGTGKTEMGRALCEELPASLYHMKAASVDAFSMEKAWEHFQYFPGEGRRFHFGLIDEADRMTEKAQDQWLSYGDSTAGIKPNLLGGMEQGEVPPIIWFHTSNGLGPKQTDPPTALHARFVTRCMVLRFEPPPVDATARYLRWVWEREGGPKKYPAEFFESLAKGIAMRDALMRLDSELLAPRTAKEMRVYLEEQRIAVEEAEQRKWEAAIADAPDPDKSERAKRAWQTMRANNQNRTAINGVRREA